MVDILLATYNGEKFLEQQLNSIFNQSYQNFRLIVKDDNSSDNTLEILKKYKEKYQDKFILIEEEKYFNCAKNNFFYLLNYSDSNYIMFCDQDDVWFYDKIEVTLHQMKLLQNQYGLNKPFLVYTDLCVCDENLNIISKSMIKYQSLLNREAYLGELLVQNNVTGCTVMINNVCRDMLYYEFSKNILMHDWWLAILCKTFGHISYLRRPTIFYRQHGNNSVGAKKYSLNFGISKLKNNTFKKSIHQSFNQANYFFKIYFHLLPNFEKQVFLNFISLKDSNFFKKNKILIKNKFLKTSLLRRVMQFVLPYY